MKKIWIMPVFLFSMNITVCAQNKGTQTIPQNGKFLTVFYSWSGNSRTIANELQTLIDTDIVEVTPQTPYTSNYNQMLDVARQEITAIDNNKNYPAISTAVGNINSYDTIFIIYPLWWSRMATPMQAFLNNHSGQLQNKTIALICTSGSTGIAQTVADARRICIESVFTEALHIRSSAVNNTKSLLATWIKNNSRNTEATR
jgi:flavodoxin